MLELEQVTRRFGAVTALEDATFAVAPGEICGFVGRNGAGKTTAMRIVLGLLEPHAGAVRWHGRPIDAAARRRFGYMPEERGLYPKMRVSAHLSYLARLHGLDREAAGAAAGHWVQRLGVAERAGDRIEQLSLGNQQRVQLGAALVHDPQLLILDEPFSGLDPLGVDALSSEIRARADAGVPVLFSSHQLDLVERICESVAIIDAGRIVATGSVEALRARAGERPRVRVAVDGDPGGRWTAGLPGPPATAGDHRGVVLALPDGMSLDALLDLARRTGTVTHFELVRPTLAETFREVVPG
ncbi:MAG: Efflux ABC transporter, ATP-binding protein [uncultured Solirubrobacteraceae bacterium]|uniref:Efflux ABC transporter, ATP-binding protein n=1 Tax=uncultured Solirubrobacteraceae bacterium TaxID=1162706 RepID=A0A6J4RE70_9ACTN|nr:MAG: Efflux ABC transporter, ATP-binding protein [uncultured Solirubrobacteraceae bacterium]